MVVKLPVQQVKYFAGARLLVLTQWGSCKPIIVIQFAFALCGSGLLIVSLAGFFLIIVRGNKLGIQCSIALNSKAKKYCTIMIYTYIDTYALTKRKLGKL